MTPAQAPARRPSRREEYAEATRAAVVDAARELFSTQGYFTTKVEEIAERSRVSPATVYAQCGGKQGLLRTLMDQWTEGPSVQAVVESVERSESPVEILDILADAYLAVHRDFGDVTRMIGETAPHDEVAARVLETATERHRLVLHRVVARLRALDALADGLGDDEVVDVVFYYFGRDRIGMTTTELGWTPERARTWIAEQLARTVLRSEGGASAPASDHEAGR